VAEPSAANDRREAAHSLSVTRAVQITRFGGPEVLDIVDLPDPVPGPGQQLYEVSSGIGAATARQLAEHGAAVALVARRKDRLDDLAADIERAGGTALVVAADITDRTEAQAAVAQTVAQFGRLDILVNNAGLMLLGPVVGADPDEWDRMITVNGWVQGSGLRS
jgi:hypothetical protein